MGGNEGNIVLLTPEMHVVLRRPELRYCPGEIPYAPELISDAGDIPWPPYGELAG